MGCALVFGANVRAQDSNTYPGAPGTGTPTDPPIMVSNKPPVIHLVLPNATAVFTAPANIGLVAEAFDQDGFVVRVEFFEGQNSLGVRYLSTTSGANSAGILTNGGRVSLMWTNVPAGQYVLRATATDNQGALAASPAITVVVRAPEPPRTVVSLAVLDAEAAEMGTIASGANTAINPAVLEVRRSGLTNDALEVFYQIGGTALNGVDYQALSNKVVIPAGQATARLYVVPIDDNLPEPKETVTIAVIPPTCIMIYPPPPSCYLVASNSAGTVYILDNDTPPPTNHPPQVRLLKPEAGMTFIAPATIGIEASAYDVDGQVTQVEFFAGNRSLGVVYPPPVMDPVEANSAGASPIYNWRPALTWSNVTEGTYTLTAVATDNQGATGVSQPVTVAVVAPPPANQPPTVTITHPPAGATLPAGSSIRIEARTVDVDGYASTVKFFANNLQIGEQTLTFIQPPPPGQPLVLSMVWSNLAAGEYTLTARAIDDQGAMGVSPGVRVVVLGVTNPPPPVTNLPPAIIVATDAYAAEGTNAAGKPNPAVFRVQRTSRDTNEPLVVEYAISGSAVNGVDYQELPGVVTIPAGRPAAEIVVLPVDDKIVEPTETVVLTLKFTNFVTIVPITTNNLPPVTATGAVEPNSANTAAGLIIQPMPSYKWQLRAAAFIVDNDKPPPPIRPLPDGTFNVSVPQGNYTGCVRIEISTNLVDWTIVGTNMVTEGAARFVDPEGATGLKRFYRVTTVPCPTTD